MDPVQLPECFRDYFHRLKDHLITGSHFLVYLLKLPSSRPLSSTTIEFWFLFFFKATKQNAEALGRVHTCGVTELPKWSGLGTPAPHPGEGWASSWLDSIVRNPNFLQLGLPLFLPLSPASCQAVD